MSIEMFLLGLLIGTAVGYIIFATIAHVFFGRESTIGIALWIICITVASMILGPFMFIYNKITGKKDSNEDFR